MDLLAIFVLFLLFGMAGFLTAIGLCGCRLRYGYRLFRRSLDLADVIEVHEGRVASVRGYPTDGLVLELRSGQAREVPYSGHLGRTRRADWLVALDSALALDCDER
jgi:hypothetical protein